MLSLPNLEFKRLPFKISVIWLKKAGRRGEDAQDQAFKHVT